MLGPTSVLKPTGLHTETPCRLWSQVGGVQPSPGHLCLQAVLPYVHVPVQPKTSSGLPVRTRPGKENPL